MLATIAMIVNEELLVEIIARAVIAPMAAGAQSAGGQGNGGGPGQRVAAKAFPDVPKLEKGVYRLNVEERGALPHAYPKGGGRGEIAREVCRSK